MKQIPMLFSTPMVLALLAGTKTQTRRIVEPQPIDNEQVDGQFYAGDYSASVRKDILHDWQHQFAYQCARWQPGDVLWVRETWAEVENDSGRMITVFRADVPDEYHKEIKWKPSIFMPRAACRLFLEITDVRVEQLQDISTEDAVAEGIEQQHRFWRDYHNKKDKGTGFLDTADITWPYERRSYSAEQASYRTLWESINGLDSWLSNPYAWCVTFKRIEQP